MLADQLPVHRMPLFSCSLADFLQAGESTVTVNSSIELLGVPIKAQIGHFAVGESDPYEHRMDLVLVIDPSLVLIREDGMQHVFDYDPLLEQIAVISQDRQYETQEMLASEVARCCAKFKQIEGIEVCLKKARPSVDGDTVSGTIGVRLAVSGADLVGLRHS